MLYLTSLGVVFLGLTKENAWIKLAKLKPHEPNASGVVDPKFALRVDDNMIFFSFFGNGNKSSQEAYLPRLFHAYK